jgi:translation initiation factor 1
MARKNRTPPTGGSSSNTNTNTNTRLAYSTGGERPAPEDAPTSPARASPGIRLRLDRRASARVVTVVTGLPGRPAEVAALARGLKTACGAGGTVKGGILEIQGDHRERVGAYLAERGLRFKRAGG